jgi:hypothetical protein
MVLAKEKFVPTTPSSAMTAYKPTYQDLPQRHSNDDLRHAIHLSQPRSITSRRGAKEPGIFAVKLRCALIANPKNCVRYGVTAEGQKLSCLKYIADVVAESPGDGAVANSLHFGECVDQAIVLAFFRGRDEELMIIGCREVIDFKTDTDDLAQLGAGAHGAGFDGFILDTSAREEGKRTHREKSNQNQSADNELMSLGNNYFFSTCSAAFR